VANRQLADQGIVADLTIRQMEAGVEQAKNRLALTTKQLETARETQQSQMAPQEVAVEQNKAAYDMALRQLRDLEVRSSLSGVLQEVNVEVGQQIGAGTALARVTDPTDLKAVIRISETQTRDLAIGLLAVIDTRNGKVRGHVARIDPASQGGTVGVDVILDEPLPPGARIDLSVDGTIELERLLDVLFVESPAFGQENSTIQLFKVLENGDAVRTTVKLGRRSVQYVEVVDGLEEGDEVILTDMSTWDGFDRVRLR
jgi:HlyD family secretion protein